MALWMAHHEQCAANPGGEEDKINRETSIRV